MNSADNILSAPDYMTSHTKNDFTVLWTLSGTTRVSWYQKVHFAIFWIFWCQMKITQADTHQQSGWTATSSRQIGAPISAIPTIFMPDALPDTTLPIYPGLGQAPNMLACMPSGLVDFNCMTQLESKKKYSCPW